jgi:hypothetical protein
MIGMKQVRGIFSRSVEWGEMPSTPLFPPHPTLNGVWWLEPTAVRLRPLWWLVRLWDDTFEPVSYVFGPEGFAVIPFEGDVPPGEPWVFTRTNETPWGVSRLDEIDEALGIQHRYYREGWVWADAPDQAVCLAIAKVAAYAALTQKLDLPIVRVSDFGGFKTLETSNRKAAIRAINAVRSAGGGTVIVDVPVLSSVVVTDMSK